jgi:broad specificity phosphatase PhoE
MNYFNQYQFYKQKYISFKGGSSLIELYFIRHGETNWNKSGRSQGQEADIELDDDGREESKKTGIYLKKFRMLDKPFDCIYSSPLKRAKETANIIKKEINHKNDVIYLNELKERKMGKLSGVTKDDPLWKKVNGDINIIDPIEKYIQKNNIIEQNAISLNIDQESITDLENRGMVALDKIINSGHKKILIISHGGLLLALLRKLFNIPMIPAHDFKKSSNCWISYIIYKNGKYKMITPANNDHFDII